MLYSLEQFLTKFLFIEQACSSMSLQWSNTATSDASFISLSVYLFTSQFAASLVMRKLRGSGKQGTIPSSFMSASLLNPVLLPVLYNGAELHNLVWCSVILWRRHLFCNLRQDTTLLCECFSFRECYADSEKQTESGPFNIFTTATEIKKGKINTAKLCHEGTPSLKVTQASVHALSEGPSHHSQLGIFSPCLVYLEQMPSPPVECHLHE